MKPAIVTIPFSHQIATEFVRTHIPANALGVIALGSQPTCDLLDWHLLVKGENPAARISPQKVIREALQMNAESFLVFVRNTEGGKHPSKADVALAKALREGGEALGVPFLDYVVVSEGDGCGAYHSFRAHEGWTEMALA